ncbi:hypothetical protein [Streptomyces sp. MS2.AVA.5]|uniref:Uncharacterized protein n=1 Tax=Streptomyces achmelvichensis TaxID=3134111 RepID=A0ACC6PKK8_9ACTN
MLAVQPLGPHVILGRIEVRVLGVQLTGLPGEAQGESLGLGHALMEGEHAVQIFLRRHLQGRGLQSAEPLAANLVGSVAGSAQSAVQDWVLHVDHQHLVRGDDAALDRFLQRQEVRHAPEEAVGVVLHGGHQLARSAAAGLVVVPGLPHPGSCGHVEASLGRDAGVVVDDCPRLSCPAAGGVPHPR